MCMDTRAEPRQQLLGDWNFLSENQGFLARFSDNDPPG